MGEAMDNRDAQKSEVHESTDDAGSSPASNARQHTDSPAQNQGQSWSAAPGAAAPKSNFERGAAERHRTNIAGVSPAESDDQSNAPPGHVELQADLADKTFYPTAVEKRDKQKPGDMRDEGAKG